MAVAPPLPPGCGRQWVDRPVSQSTGDSGQFSHLWLPLASSRSPHCAALGCRGLSRTPGHVIHVLRAILGIEFDGYVNLLVGGDF